MIKGLLIITKDIRGRYLWTISITRDSYITTKWAYMYPASAKNAARRTAKLLNMELTEEKDA